MTSEYLYLEPGNSCFFSTFHVSCRLSLEINRSHFSFFFMCFEFYFGDEWRGGEGDDGERRRRRERGGEETKVSKIMHVRAGAPEGQKRALESSFRVTPFYRYNSQNILLSSRIFYLPWFTCTGAERKNTGVAESSLESVLCSHQIPGDSLALTDWSVPQSR